jgi:tRNA(fMet)-specific endonuclease VapC
MLQYMLDTNICIYVIKDYPGGLRDKFNQLSDELCMSTITLGELQYGAERSTRRAQNLEGIARFIARLDVLPFSASAAGHYGQLRAELQRAGRPAGPLDMLIGAHARSEGLIVVTNNEREFARMPGLRVENWIASA